MSLLRLPSLLLPALIPSWRFFRAIAPSPRVELRVDGGPWQEVAVPPAHLSLGQMLLRLIWNPQRTAALYLVSLSERIVEQGSHRAEAELLERLARDYGREHRLEARLTFVTRGAAGLESEVLYESAPFTGGRA
ncbi:hypothetical protein J4E08_15550 [Sagittula sp. NFXS13]|uniref:hypothetical protein n=1 Tax=Sagittula sp. NFXS13 TaxID=2819095 RepID=UPI0032DFDA2C